jgi:SAM-dependent methyltransferase
MQLIHDLPSCKIHKDDNQCVKEFKCQHIFDNHVRFHSLTSDMDGLVQPWKIQDNKIYYPWMGNCLAHNSTLTKEQKEQIFKDVCLTVYHLFERGIAHGDIYASNIYLNKDLKPLIADPWMVQIPEKQSFYDSHDLYCKQPDSIHAGKKVKPCLKTLAAEIGIELDPYECVCNFLKEEIKRVSGSESYHDMKGGNTYTSYENKNFKMNGWRNTKERLSKFNVDFNGKTVLDIGCNCGAISMYLAEQGANVSGIDISADRIRLCRRLNQFMGLDVQFDYKTAVEPLQHDYDIIVAFAVTGRTGNEQSVLKDICLHCKELLFESNHCTKDNYPEIFKSLGFESTFIGETGPFPIRKQYYCRKI